MHAGLGAKGSLAVLVAVAAMVLLVLTVDSAANAGHSDATFTRLEAVSAASLAEENAVRVLDKAAAQLLQDHSGSPPNCQPGSISAADAQAYFNSVIAAFNSVGAANCTISGFSFSQPGVNLNAGGTLSCSAGLGPWKGVVQRAFSFGKKAVKTGPGNGGSCGVQDSVSACVELPSFDPGSC